MLTLENAVFFDTPDFITVNEIDYHFAYNEEDNVIWVTLAEKSDGEYFRKMVAIVTQDGDDWNATYEATDGTEGYITLSGEVSIDPVPGYPASVEDAVQHLLEHYIHQ